MKNQKALGRVTVIADPAVLAANPAADPLLESGDVVYVPQRPYSVSVLGEVLQPGSILFRQGMPAEDYIDHAGGYSQFADTSNTIIVLPDGSARRMETSWFDFGSEFDPTGKHDLRLARYLGPRFASARDRHGGDCQPIRNDGCGTRGAVQTVENRASPDVDSRRPAVVRFGFDSA